jgi:hypothetical protein
MKALRRGGRDQDQFPACKVPPGVQVIPNYVVFWTFDFQQGVLASQEFPFAALRGGRCSSAPESSWMDQTASAPTSGALLMYPFLPGGHTLQSASKVQ